MWHEKYLENLPNANCMQYIRKNDAARLPSEAGNCNYTGGEMEEPALTYGSAMS